jgi:excisionase family DNA binding protein
MDKIEPEKGSKQLLTKRELAGYLGMSVRGVEGLMAARKIPFFSLGHRTVRFDFARVVRALERLEVKPY